MKFKALLVMPIALLLTGCVTSGNFNKLSSRVDALEGRVSSLEQVVYVKGQPSTPESFVVSKMEKTELSKKEIQTALKNAGFYNGPVDGVIGKKTRAAIRAFQKANGVKPDGVIGKKTETLLLKYLK
jgi:murein L,D-transpeptidase YcbB/YkuD